VKELLIYTTGSFAVHLCLCSELFIWIFFFLLEAFFFIGNSCFSKEQSVLRESFQLHFLKLE